ncbi:kinase-like domain-containing protein [Chaetomium strumarium]|uniref:Autophagy-related protein 1 n=1 Tax=Chaetomium strumarium TaxID=1170767 RepID=A0AAJ0M2E0_9PEZI|nr:kinase-like domain-containing protein [Chaetomium strumarium]
MQHVSAFGYPTPPASPAFGQPCAIPSQHITVQQRCLPRYAPVAPEERLGRFLTNSLQLRDIVGTGAYGVVYSAVDIETNARYAVKCLSKFNADGTPLDRRQVAFQSREIRLHYLASTHANVVSILKIIDYLDCIYVVLEYCPEGDLFYNITERRQYVGKDELAKKVFLQLLDAVEHCHSLGIYHRDLKPENILVSDQGETVKLADFGLATSDERSEDYGCGSTFYMSPGGSSIIIFFLTFLFRVKSFPNLFRTKAHAERKDTRPLFTFSLCSPNNISPLLPKLTCCLSLLYLECLDQSARRPFYYCAPNDVWSLGVILVNLTCGRNPWKQASYEDSTYRAYATSQDFLKTILPVSDELNDILGRIFNRNPDERIRLPELRARILACSRFTEQPTAAPLPKLSVSPDQPTDYVCEESLIMDSEYYDQNDDDHVPLSPTSSDGESAYSSDEGSLTSDSGSSDGDFDEDDYLEEMPEAKTPPPQAQAPFGDPAIYEPEDSGLVSPYHQQPQECLPSYPLAAAPEHMHPPVPLPVQPACAPKVQLPLHMYVWDILRYGQPTPPVPQLHHPIPFHQQVPLFAHMQGCY